MVRTKKGKRLKREKFRQKNNCVWGRYYFIVLCPFCKVKEVSLTFLHSIVLSYRWQFCTVFLPPSEDDFPVVFLLSVSFLWCQTFVVFNCWPVQREKEIPVRLIFLFFFLILLTHLLYSVSLFHEKPSRLTAFIKYRNSALLSGAKLFDFFFPNIDEFLFYDDVSLYQSSWKYTATALPSDWHSWSCACHSVIFYVVASGSF